MDSHSKFGLHLKIDEAMYTPREYKNIYYLQLGQIGLRKKGKNISMGFYGGKTGGPGLG